MVELPEDCPVLVESSSVVAVAGEWYGRCSGFVSCGRLARGIAGLPVATHLFDQDLLSYFPPMHRFDSWQGCIVCSAFGMRFCFGRLKIQRKLVVMLEICLVEL